MSRVWLSASLFYSFPFNFHLWSYFFTVEDGGRKFHPRKPGNLSVPSCEAPLPPRSRLPSVLAEEALSECGSTRGSLLCRERRATRLWFLNLGMGPWEEPVQARQSLNTIHQPCQPEILKLILHLKLSRNLGSPAISLLCPLVCTIKIHGDSSPRSKHSHIDMIIKLITKPLKVVDWLFWASLLGRGGAGW